jgi:hypothetical protein
MSRRRGTGFLSDVGKGFVMGLRGVRDVAQFIPHPGVQAAVQGSRLIGLGRRKRRVKRGGCPGMKGAGKSGNPKKIFKK